MTAADLVQNYALSRDRQQRPLPAAVVVRRHRGMGSTVTVTQGTDSATLEGRSRVMTVTTAVPMSSGTSRSAIETAGPSLAVTAAVGALVSVSGLPGVVGEAHLDLDRLALVGPPPACRCSTSPPKCRHPRRSPGSSWSASRAMAALGLRTRSSCESSVPGIRRLGREIPCQHALLVARRAS